MDPAQFLPQLGVAGTIVLVVLYILKLVLDGKLHTDAEIAVRDKQVEALTKRVDELLGQNTALTEALAASNEQSRAIIALWKELQTQDGDLRKREVE